MEQEGVAPDPATYNLQLAMHQKRARHEACAELFRTVSSRGATLTVQGYNAVLKSLSELNAPAAQVPPLQKKKKEEKRKRKAETRGTKRARNSFAR